MLANFDLTLFGVTVALLCTRTALLMRSVSAHKAGKAGPSASASGTRARNARVRRDSSPSRPSASEHRELKSVAPSHCVRSAAPSTTTTPEVGQPRDAPP